MKKDTRILVGADPELFMVNPNNNEFVSAHDHIPGTKRHPFPVENGAVQVDGTALEFNIDPAATEDQFVHNITSVYTKLSEMVPGFRLELVPVARFKQDYFDALPAEAKMLGCDPDYDAWSGNMNNPPDNKQPMRTASGHVHVGWTENEDIYDEEHVENCRYVVRQLDYFLGMPSLLFDKDATRRQMYGRAGAFRVKPYGVEYRVLSNAWLKSPELMKWVFNSTVAGVEACFKGDAMENKHGDLARRVINDNETDWVKKMGNILPISLPPVGLANVAMG